MPDGVNLGPLCRILAWVVLAEVVVVLSPHLVPDVLPYLLASWVAALEDLACSRQWFPLYVELAVAFHPRVPLVMFVRHRRAPAGNLLGLLMLPTLALQTSCYLIEAIQSHRMFASAAGQTLMDLEAQKAASSGVEGQRRYSTTTARPPLPSLRNH